MSHDHQRCESREELLKHGDTSPCIDRELQELCEWVYDGVSTPVAADWYCKTCGAVDIHREPPSED